MRVGRAGQALQTTVTGYANGNIEITPKTDGHRLPGGLININTDLKLLEFEILLRNKVKNTPFSYPNLNFLDLFKILETKYIGFQLRTWRNPLSEQWPGLGSCLKST